MGAYTNLKNAIKQVIKQNGNQEITGQLLQNTLLSMVDTLGTDYKYCGIATPTTVPSTEEGNIYYFAKESGSYTNFTDSAHTNLHIDEQGLYVFTKNAETGWWSSENLVSIADELGDATDKVVSQKAVTEIHRLYDILSQSILSILNNAATLSISGIYYSTSKNQIVYSNSTYNSYVLRVEEAKTYIIENIKVFNNIVYILEDYPNVGDTNLVNYMAAKNEITIPTGIKYILINVQVDSINKAARIYPKDSLAYYSNIDNLAHKIDELKYFNGTYINATTRDALKETGIYINSKVIGANNNPAIMLVRVEDNGSGKIYQMEITTNNTGSPLIRIRQDVDGQSGWSEWKVISIDNLANTWLAGIVTVNQLNEAIDQLNEAIDQLNEAIDHQLNEAIDQLNETDRLYFHRLLLKRGWLGVNGVISQVQWENCYSFLLGVKEGDVISYTNGYQYAFLSDDINFVNGAKAQLVEGTNRINSFNKDNIIVPATCKYLWISGHYASSSESFFDYQPDTITINGTTYVISNDKNARIPNLVDRIIALESQAQENTVYPNGILRYTADSKTFQFFMYKGVSNLYFSVTMALKTDNSDEVYLNEYRWVDGGLYSYSNGTFLRIAGTVSYMENEMAMKFMNSGDYTGGVHGDERIDVEENSFAKFFADGKLLSDTDLSNDFEKECSEFSYIQYSTLHETKGISSKEANSHPIIAHHLKHNIFKDCASFLDNTVKFDVDNYNYSNLVVEQYHAIIMCVDKESATTTLLPDFAIIDTSAGTNASTSASNPNNATVIQWDEKNGIKVITEGHFTEGLSDDMKNNPSGTPVYSVWDRPQDSKIYRRYHNLNKQVTKGYIIRNHQEVHFS